MGPWPGGNNSIAIAVAIAPLQDLKWNSCASLCRTNRRLGSTSLQHSTTLVGHCSMQPASMMQDTALQHAAALHQVPFTGQLELGAPQCCRAVPLRLSSRQWECPFPKQTEDPHSPCSSWSLQTLILIYVLQVIEVTVDHSPESPQRCTCAELDHTRHRWVQMFFCHRVAEYLDSWI